NCIEIIKKSVGVEFGLFPFLLIYTGCRKNEALALTDKDFTEDSISISKSVYWHSDGKPEITVPKTSAAIREVFLLPPLAQVLPKWEGYLFSCDGGKTPLSSQQFFKLWSRLEEVYIGKTDIFFEPGRLTRKLVPHRKSDGVICESVDGESIAAYVNAFDGAMKAFFSRVNEPADASSAAEAHMANYIRNNDIIM
ncbi:MAG: hypothetical protein II664_08120, partial [Oscillospiraceae bacterium]|nr:hypothetical protein [Oscillospiraceae bacterium]